MNLFLPSMRWERENLDSEIVSMATSRVFRIRRVGTTYFCEQLVGPDDWKIKAISKPEDQFNPKTGEPLNPPPRLEIHRWMADANARVFEIMRRDRQRSAVPNGSRAHGAGDGHA